jgi:uncharacterized protein YhaN
MTDQNTTNDVIDIDPESVIENVPQNKPSPKSSRGILLVGVAMLSAVAGGWLYRDVLSSYLPSDQIIAMTTRMDTLEAASITLNKKVDAVVGFTDEMKSQLSAAQASAATIPQLQSDEIATMAKVATLQKSLADLSTSVDALKTQILTAGPTSGGDNSALAAQLDNLAKDVASLKQGNGTNTDTAALSQSLADVKAKIAAGTGFNEDIQRIKLMVPAAEGLDVLEAQSETGIPNAQGLAKELTALIPELKPATPSNDQADTSWWSYASTFASGIITIKSDGTEDWSLAANQAITFAEQSDLQGAVNVLEKTEGAMPVDLQKWHDRATLRLQLEQALNKASAAVLRQIAAKG